MFPMDHLPPVMESLSQEHKMKIKYSINLDIDLNEKDIDWATVSTDFNPKNLNIYYFLKEIDEVCQRFVTKDDSPRIEASIKDIKFKNETMN